MRSANLHKLPLSQLPPIFSSFSLFPSFSRPNSSPPFPLLCLELDSLAFCQHPAPPPPPSPPTTIRWAGGQTDGRANCLQTLVNDRKQKLHVRFSLPSLVSFSFYTSRARIPESVSPSPQRVPSPAFFVFPAGFPRVFIFRFIGDNWRKMTHVIGTFIASASSLFIFPFPISLECALLVEYPLAVPYIDDWTSFSPKLIY